MHVILWKFRARPGHEAAFEAAYGDKGAWSTFFRTGEGYVGTELMRATDGTYLTVDRWISADAYRTFRDVRAAEYERIDARCAVLTIEETPLGAVDA
jgi:heme-degrading monooxygenase HmoA